jgi:hypothetical protein
MRPERPQCLRGTRGPPKPQILQRLIMLQRPRGPQMIPRLQLIPRLQRPPRLQKTQRPQRLRRHQKLQTPHEDEEATKPL